MNITELLKSLGLEFAESGHHHCRPGWVQLQDCPFCGSHNYHLGFSLQGGFFSCWRCGGHAVRKVLPALGVPPKQIKEVLGELSTEDHRPTRRVCTGLVEPKRRGPLLPAHRAYLEGRGFDPDQLVRLWELEGIGIASRLAWRIYIPIHHQGRRVSWTTRTIGKGAGVRYLSASPTEEALNHKALVYGADMCHHAVVVVEGPADAWRVGPGAGALFGTAFTTAQVRTLVGFPARYVCFDNSPPAQERAEALCGQLALFPGTTENVVLDAEDPGSASTREIKLLRRAASL